MINEDIVLIEEDAGPEELVISPMPVDDIPEEKQEEKTEAKRQVMTIKVPIPDIRGGKTEKISVQLKTDVIGVVGHSIVQTSKLTVYRLCVRNNEVQIGLLNTAEYTIKDKVMYVDLLKA